MRVLLGSDGRWTMRTPMSAVCLSLIASPGVAEQVPVWHLDRVLRVGSATDLESGFVRPGSVILYDSQLFVMERDDMTIRRFSLDGEFLGSFGGRGEGPGEFNAITRVGMLGEKLWVWDSRLSRIQFFSSEGGLDSLVTIRGHPTAPLFRLAVQGLLSDGSLLAVPDRYPDEEVNDPIDVSYLLRLDSQGMIRDTVSELIWRTPHRDVSHELGVRGRRYLTILPVMPPSSQWSVARDGSGFVVVHPQLQPGSSGDPGFRVVRLSASADTVWTKAFSHTQIPVSREFLETEIQALVEMNERGPGTGIAAGRWERAFREAFEDIRNYPPVSGVVAGVDGSTWLRIQQGEALFEWHVLDEAGTPIGRLREPQGSWLRVPGLDAVWFQEEDELGVPYLESYAVIR